MNTHKEDNPELKRISVIPSIGKYDAYACTTVDHDRQVMHIEYHYISTNGWYQFFRARYPFTIDVSVGDNVTGLTVTVGLDEKYAVHEEFEYTGDSPFTMDYATLALSKALEVLTIRGAASDADTGLIQLKLHQEYFNALKQLGKRRIH